MRSIKTICARLIDEKSPNPIENREKKPKDP